MNTAQVDNSDLITTAWHEAGHAVAYLLHNQPFTHVWVAGTEGEVATAPGQTINTTVALMVTHAGPIAEALHHLGGPSADIDPETFLDAVEAALDAGGDDDLDFIVDTNRELGLDGDSQQAIETAVRVVVTNAWPQITAVAEALIERGTLTHAEVAVLANGAR